MSRDYIILKFSVCKKLLANRQEVAGDLEQKIIGIKILSFHLEDKLFTMDVRTTARLEDIILGILTSYGYTVKFIRAV